MIKNINKKTIIIIFHFAGTPENGMNYRPYYLAKYFKKHGYNVIVVGSGYHHQMKKIKNIDKDIVVELYEGIKYLWIPTCVYNANNYVKRTYNLFLFWYRLIKFDLKSVVDTDDILSVIASSPSILSGYNGYIWARRYKAKFIFEVRDIWPMSLIEFSRINILNPIVLLFKYFERFSYKKTDALVSLIPLAKEYMMMNGLEEKKYHYIPNGIDTETDNEGKTEELDEYLSFTKKKFVVGYLGSIGVANNLDALLNTAELLVENKEIQIAVVGGGPKSDELIKRYGNLSNVTFIPPVPKKNVFKVIERFDVCYIGLQKAKMFQYGVSPNKLFEYMYSEKPVIQAINTGYDIVEKAKCGITVKPDSPLEIKSAILKLYKLPKENREMLGKKGKEYILKNHTYSQIIREYLSLITSNSRTQTR